MPSSAAMRCVDTLARPSWLNNVRLASRMRSRVRVGTAAMASAGLAHAAALGRRLLLRRRCGRIAALQMLVDRLELPAQLGQGLGRRHAQPLERAGDTLVEQVFEFVVGHTGLLDRLDAARQQRRCVDAEQRFEDAALAGDDIVAHFAECFQSGAQQTFGACCGLVGVGGCSRRWRHRCCGSNGCRRSDCALGALACRRVVLLRHGKRLFRESKGKGRRNANAPAFEGAEDQARRARATRFFATALTGSATISSPATRSDRFFEPWATRWAISSETWASGSASAPTVSSACTSNAVSMRAPAPARPSMPLFTPRVTVSMPASARSLPSETPVLTKPASTCWASIRLDLTVSVTSGS